MSQKMKANGQIIGKAYANRKDISKRPESDFYSTPISLVWELLKTDELKGVKTILEPCCGELAISNELEKAGFEVTSRDLRFGNDFILDEYKADSFDAVVTNPPFSIFDDIVNKAKFVAPKVIVIGKTNFFGVHSRNINHFWKNLKSIYIFDRQVEYRTPFRTDGLFCVGCLVTCWMIFDKSYFGNPEIKIMDVQKYAKLGSLEKFLKMIS